MSKLSRRMKYMWKYAVADGLFKWLCIAYGWVTMALASLLVLIAVGASLMIGSICIATTMIPGGYGCVIQWGLTP